MILEGVALTVKTTAQTAINYEVKLTASNTLVYLREYKHLRMLFLGWRDRSVVG